MIFWRSEGISRGSDVTMALAFNRTTVLIRIFSENAPGYVNFGCLPPAVQEF